ncbi:DnaJ domain-containing protein [Enterococcus sp. ZJ1622]|uniref:DnaJ domain-containing protein n=1 Tax=Enterococcus sp. ZJ1622 TaxID=2709401 RepID=UPI0019802AB1|nr:DnaJ domain-containing protein [Enterococcus sp. ZJ1622]
MFFLFLMIFYLFLLCLWLLIAALAFPEITVYLIIFSLALFNPYKVGAWQSEPFATVYTAAEYFHHSLPELHLGLKLVVLLSIPLIYLMLLSLIRYKSFYPLQVMGVFVNILTVFYLMESFLAFDQVWTFVLAIPVSLLTVSARTLVYQKLNAFFSIEWQSSHFRRRKKQPDPEEPQEESQEKTVDDEPIQEEEPFDPEAYFRLILGVSENATKEEIKQAYRQKVMRYHPDKSTEENAKEKYEEIIEAYRHLK